MQNYVKDERSRKDAASIDYMLDDEKGRWFLMRLMDNCHIFNSLYTGAEDTNKLLIFEGERRAALTIRNNICSLPDGLAMLQQAEAEYADWKHHVQEIIKEK